MVEGLIMPPTAHGVRVISMLPFKPGGVTQPVTWRGPMLHRALQQFLADVWWGDLDVLLVDLPPGTGDVAISAAQLLPHAEVIVVTTPQIAAAEVAVRAGMVAKETHQRIAGVVENMSAFPCPHCGEPMDLFGSGGGQRVAELPVSRALDTDGPAARPHPLRRAPARGRRPRLAPGARRAGRARGRGAQRDRRAARQASRAGWSGLSLGLTPAGRFLSRVSAQVAVVDG